MLNGKVMSMTKMLDVGSQVSKQKISVESQLERCVSLKALRVTQYHRTSKKHPPPKYYA